MSPTKKHFIAMCFAILFMVITIAPTIIVSIDDSVDIASFYGENEEEEKENLKLLFEINAIYLESETQISQLSNLDTYYTKRYSKPHLNILFPPPDYF